MRRADARLPVVQVLFTAIFKTPPRTNGRIPILRRYGRICISSMIYMIVLTQKACYVFAFLLRKLRGRSQSKSQSF